MAIVGLAAGTAARQATAIYGDNLAIEGFELDDRIVEVGRKYFDMNLPNRTVHVGEGRLNLERSPHKYDIIAVDAYRPPYIPPHMTTREFFEIVASHLNDDGVLTLNVGSVPGDRRLINGLATTMATHFPSIHIMDIPGTLNTMIFATKQPTSRDDFIVVTFLALAVYSERAFLPQISDEKPEVLRKFLWALNVNTIQGLIILLLTSIAQAG